MLERFVFPILSYAGTAAAMLVCLYLFFTLKREIAAVASRKQNEREALKTAIRDLRQRMEELERNIEAMSGDAASPAVSIRSININKRMQALRMARRGDGPERISAALGLPASEARLLAKVQRLIADAAVKSTA
jgi:cell division protein FtsB